MKFCVRQLAPSGFGLPISAASTQQALDVVGSMIQRGAIAVEIIDGIGLHYDLIDLERLFDDEIAGRSP